MILKTENLINTFPAYETYCINKEYKYLVANIDVQINIYDSCLYFEKKNKENFDLKIGQPQTDATFAKKKSCVKKKKVFQKF